MQSREHPPGFKTTALGATGKNAETMRILYQVIVAYFILSKTRTVKDNLVLKFYNNVCSQITLVSLQTTVRKKIFKAFVVSNQYFLHKLIIHNS